MFRGQHCQGREIWLLIVNKGSWDSGNVGRVFGVTSLTIFTKLLCQVRSMAHLPKKLTWSCLLPPMAWSMLQNRLTYRVDSVLKVSHVPSLRRILLSEEQDCAKSLHSPSREALESTMCFTAVCTLTEAESRDIFMEEKAKVMNRFRLETEIMLSRADCLTTSDIIVLQAFMIYLVINLL